MTERFHARATVVSHERKETRYKGVPFSSYKICILAGPKAGMTMGMFVPWIEQQFRVGSAIDVIVTPMKYKGKTYMDARWARHAPLWFWSTDVEAQFFDNCIEGWKEWYQYGCDSHAA